MRVKKNKGQPGQLKKHEEMLNNLNSWAMEQIRVHRERENLVQMLTTCVTLLIKDCIGRGLSEEETAALVEALDGPAKEVGDGQSTGADTAGESTTGVSDNGGGVATGQVGTGAPTE